MLFLDKEMTEATPDEQIDIHEKAQQAEVEEEFAPQEEVSLEIGVNC